MQSNFYLNVFHNLSQEDKPKIIFLEKPISWTQFRNSLSFAFKSETEQNEISKFQIWIEDRKNFFDMSPEHLFILSNGTSIKIEFFPKNVSILEETRISTNNFQAADSDLFEIVTTKSHSEIINSQHLPTEAPKELKDDVEVIDEGDLFQDTCVIQVPEFKSIQIIYVEIKNKKALDDKAYRKEQFLQFRNKISEWASSKKMILTVEGQEVIIIRF